MPLWGWLSTKLEISPTKIPDVWTTGVCWGLRKVALAGIRTQDVELTPTGQACFSSPSLVPTPGEVGRDGREGPKPSIHHPPPLQEPRWEEGSEWNLHSFQRLLNTQHMSEFTDHLRMRDLELKGAVFFLIYI